MFLFLLLHWERSICLWHLSPFYHFSNYKLFSILSKPVIARVYIFGHFVISTKFVTLNWGFKAKPQDLVKVQALCFAFVSPPIIKTRVTMCHCWTTFLPQKVLKETGQYKKQIPNANPSTNLTPTNQKFFKLLATIYKEPQIKVSWCSSMT